MKKVIFTTFTLICLLVPITTMAGAPCPIDSCNPHNSCTQGCYVQRINGATVCNSQNPLKAEEDAKRAAWNVGYTKCYNGLFLRSKWLVRQHGVGQQCYISAEADISCYN